MNEILLPLPKSFADFCRYDLYEAIPVWMEGCINNKNRTTVYANLFEPSLQLKHLDQSSYDAIAEFTPTIIDYKKLITGLELEASDINISSILVEEYLSDALHRNGIDTVNDLIEFGISNVSQLSYIGHKKYFYILVQISNYLENLNPENSSNDAVQILETDEIIQKIEANSNIPFDKFNLDDPRFIHIKHHIAQYVDYENLIHDDWLSFLINTAESRSSKVLDAIDEFKSSFDLIDSMTLEEQMSQLFEFLGTNNKSIRNIIKDEFNFGILRDRLGIRQDTKPALTLQEAGDLSNPPVTRERIRQKMAMFSKALSFANGEEIYIPKLHSIKRIIDENLNINVDTLVEIISERGYGKWCIERLFSCFDLFNIHNDYAILESAITNSSVKKRNKNILKIGRKISSYNGAVNLHHLTKVLQDSGFDITPREVEDILLIGFKKLDENWYVCYEVHNVFHLTHAQRLANFNKRIKLQDIRDAHIKHKKLREASFYKDSKRTGFYGFVTPPSKVIGKILEHFNDFYSVEDEIVHCRKLENTFLDKIDGADYQFLKYFQARNFDVATHDDMKKYFVIDGNMKEASYYLYITYKPYIKRYAHRIYGIVGYEPEEDSVSNAKNRIQKKLAPKIEWAANGGINIRMQIHSISNFTFTTYGYEDYISTEVFRFPLEGEVFEARRSSNFWYGNVKRIIIDKLFCELGDFISIDLDIEKNEGKIALISESDYFD